MNESDLWRRWREKRGRSPIQVNGEAWDVAFPGRGPARAGPDFQGALFIQADGARRRGDVEVHRLSSQWRAHGHHRDPAYNGVVLHVVERDDLGTPICLEDGREVPALPLEAWLGPVGASGAPQGLAPSPGGLAALLDRAGEERMEEKAARFRDEMAGDAPSQVLYRGLMGALGYSQNKGAFRQIADRLPLRRLEAVAALAGPEEAVVKVEALLLGHAGLLPSQIGFAAADPWEHCLEAAWRECGDGAAPVGLSWWGRPGNHPARRLAGAARLVSPWDRAGLVARLLRPLEAASPEAAGRELTRALMVEASGYWLARAAPGVDVSRSPSALVGRGRAADMAVNIALPFNLAWARREKAPDLEQRCLDVYGCYPKLPDNGLLGRMRDCLGPGAGLAATTARRQQGLLALEGAVCYQGGCLDCPFRGAPDARV